MSRYVSRPGRHIARVIPATLGILCPPALRTVGRKVSGVSRLLKASQKCGPCAVVTF